MAQATAIAPVSEVRINRFMAQVYLIMAIGLVVTGLTATWTSNELGRMINLAMRPGFAFGLFILQVLIVVALSAAAMRMNPGVAFLLFLFYSGLTGVTISSIFLVYTEEHIAQVFWITAGTFFLTSLVGLVLRRDMSSYGGLLFMLLIGWMIAWIFSWLFPYSVFNWGLTYIGIALFVGLTAYDTQRLKQIGSQMDGHPARGGLAVLGALTLYLNFINLFLLILRARNR
jgi:FtsH-binding integral membrane protein